MLTDKVEHELKKLVLGKSMENAYGEREKGKNRVDMEKIII